MSRLLSDYGYTLPPELIASRPLEKRDASRMMVLDRRAGTISHHRFAEFPDFVQSGDIVALNDSKVIKARLLAGPIEIFLLERVAERTWLTLSKPGRKTRTGMQFEIAGTMATIKDILPSGERIVVFDEEPDLEKHGHVPVPPYLKRGDDADDTTRYQTVYAKNEGSVAAPTAGLHFTPEILARIPHAFVTLHVGAGTFLPVKTENIKEHRMHEERYAISLESAGALNEATKVVAVGTTVMRVLEAQPAGPLIARNGRTDIFIYPPYTFKHVGALLTNFHLPHSTLLMLVSAFAGREFVLEAYAKAVEERYRFFSYGDCMLLI